jgi:hypothetical protein
MLLPLGILASAGGVSGAPAMEWISTTYGTGSSASIDLTSIPQTYKHLQLRMQMFADNNAAKMTFNNVTTSTYASHRLHNSSSTALTSDNEPSQAQIWMRYTVGTSDPYVVPTVVCDILDYTSTTKNKTARWLAGRTDTASGTHYVLLGSGFLQSTNAITSIKLDSAVGSFRTNTRISLYGVKG